MADPRPTARAPARLDALDRLRGLALVGMLLQHVTDWMTGDARAVLPGGRTFTLTDVAPVAFFAAAGASMALLAASRRRRGLGRARTAALVARRYGLLVPLGMGLGWVFWRSPLMFGVLEALGVAVLLAAAVAAAVPDRHLPAATAAVLVAGAVSVHVAGRRGRPGPLPRRRRLRRARPGGDGGRVRAGAAAVAAGARRRRPGGPAGRRPHARDLPGPLPALRRPAPPRPARHVLRRRGRGRCRQRDGGDVPGRAPGAAAAVVAAHRAPAAGGPRPGR